MRLYDDYVFYLISSQGDRFIMLLDTFLSSLPANKLMSPELQQ
jgi:hypothetical protein